MRRVSALRRRFNEDSLAPHDQAQLLREAMLRTQELFEPRAAGELLERILQDTVDLLGATVARFRPFEEVAELESASDEETTQPLTASAVALPALAAQMEKALLTRALQSTGPLLSNHRELDLDLLPLAEQCATAGITTEVFPLRVGGAALGAVAVHWLGVPRGLARERDSVFGAYWRAASLALAGAVERARLGTQLSELEVSAFRDRLTGLPNSEALERQLEAHEGTWPFSLLVLDFDGMREANTAWGYRDGGDILIAAVGQALAELAREGESPARLHTAGDEFCLLLPTQNEPAARRRRGEIELALDELDLPAQFNGLYGGASVGHASRVSGETPGQTLGRAVEAMRERKLERKAQSPPDTSS